MNTQLLGELVRLRYKLMWAKTRTRNGKIALFFAGYILLIMVIAILGAGGIGAGILAVRSGKGYPMAAALLGGMFVQALLATVVLGFGMSQIFSDAEMRRYPLIAPERLLVRHLIGILDPFWFLILALELGLALGMYFFGAGSFWLGLIAVLLLFVSNYLFARVLGQLVERLVSKKGGSTLLFACIMSVGLLPSTVGRLLKNNPHQAQRIIDVLRYTPPAGAAQTMTHVDLAAGGGLAILAAWIVGLTAALVALERRPIKPRVAQATKVSWDSPFERIGALLGPRNAVLVAQWLRFYSRNNRFRMIYPLAVPLIAFLVIIFPSQVPPESRFVTALGAFTMIGFMGTVQFAVNQFGYVGGGFRRYMLLPVNPSDVLRTGSFTFLLLSSALIPPAILVLLLFPPVPLEWRMVVMFVGAAFTSMFGMNGLALWITLLAPRRGNYNASFGNDLSFAANVVVMGSAMTLLFGPRLLAKAWPDLLGPANWWIVVPLVAVAVAFYFSSLRLAERSFMARREHLLAIMEGRA
jgi:hypothetical protein